MPGAGCGACASSQRPVDHNAAAKATPFLDIGHPEHFPGRSRLSNGSSPINMMTDLRHAFRLLWKSKRITAPTLVTLALCIGATTAIFSSVYSLMLKPLPYQEPDRIVELYSSAVKAGLNHMPANVPFYLDYSRNASSYESVGLWTLF